MSTVDKAFADRIIQGNGYIDGDDDNTLGDNPRCVKIVKYDNAFGGHGYGLLFPDDRPDKYEETEFVGNPITYWVYKPQGL
jgi:hypothetical protein